MSAINVSVENLQLPPFPAGQPASEMYKTLKASGRGYLVGPNGLAIVNNSNLIPAGNYTYVRATAFEPRGSTSESEDDESHYDFVKTTLKRMADFLDEEEKKESKKSCAISSIPEAVAGVWRNLSIHRSDLPPFGWDERLERGQPDIKGDSA